VLSSLFSFSDFSSSSEFSISMSLVLLSNPPSCSFSVITKSDLFDELVSDFLSSLEFSVNFSSSSELFDESVSDFLS
jgi:hypothetical protein